MQTLLTDQPMRVAGRSSGHLAVLDSLRGLMALWVVLGHIGEFSAYRLDNAPWWMQPILKPQIAVEVFILLSGFVIARLITKKRESYWVFMTRRFMRLWPAFAIVCGLSILSLPLIKGTLAWQAALVSPDEAVSYASTTEHFWIHLLAAVPMAQGLIPGQAFEWGFLPPAWSISLEWQFYLVAPFLVAGIIGKRYWLAIILLVCVLSAGRLNQIYPTRSFLPTHLGLFVLGILSYRFYLMSDGTGWSWLCAFSGVALLPFSAALGLWLFTMALVCGKPSFKLASHPLLVRLGTISFSVYLVHYPLLRILKALVLANYPQLTRGQMVLFLLLTAVPLTLLSASLLYTFVEQPGIRLGKKLTT